MVDWNHDGKVDAVDYAITSSMLDDNEEKLTGCCGSAVSLLLIGFMLPVIMTIVFISH